MRILWCRYIELAVDPDWPKAKLTQKLRDIRDERARLESSLEHTVEQLEQGHTNARRILNYLDQPHELYEQANTQSRTKLNRLLFARLKIDVGSDFDVHVASDELTEPFATIVFLRREQYPESLLRDRACEPQPGPGSNEEGGYPGGDAAFSSRVLALLQPALAMNATESSSNSTLAEDRVSGFTSSFTHESRDR